MLRVLAVWGSYYLRRQMRIHLQLRTQEYIVISEICLKGLDITQRIMQGSLLIFMLYDLRK
jgi:hypothetical protein